MTSGSVGMEYGRARRLVTNEDGYATVVACGVIVGLLAVLVMVMYVGAAVVARHRAQSAADLAALAAAIELSSAQGDPCVVARSIVTAQPSARLANCEVLGTDVVVQAEIPIELGFFGFGVASTQARAGPA